ncbi:hypothetical protein FA95DRAFT_710640 [Auriscalpium vulgare]|uniref:Uncharacterized protein n=1 Tax=Auriscalpium vulgare TaxID=40419 RepID=A0ACB8RBA1_9AGAM|nr:hypothetical protein FA95DRAFT_710640 [Auriscalpium vulgare]
MRTARFAGVQISAITIPMSTSGHIRASASAPIRAHIPSHLHPITSLAQELPTCKAVPTLSFHAAEWPRMACETAPQDGRGPGKGRLNFADAEAARRSSIGRTG